MNAERQFQEMPSRVVQPKRRGEGLQMRDHRLLAALQAKMLGTVQRESGEEDELTQGKAETAQRQTENRTGIPDAVKQRMEDSFGTDFSSVRVHPDSPKAPEVGALAYTQGTDIHFAPGQFKPDTAAGQQLLGHELTHVVQQAEGRVQPTTEIGGMPVNDSEALEHEADVRGARAVNQLKCGNREIQRKKVEVSSIAKDFFHRDARRLFTRRSYSFFRDKIAEVGRANLLEDYVTANRDKVEYEQLRDSRLQNGKQLINWLETEGVEHMYVHSGGVINIASRSTEKLPHPTLVGGDPDAKSAGTMYMVNKDVHITCDSGHFRPSSVNGDTKKYVEDIHKGKGKRVIVHNR